MRGDVNTIKERLDIAEVVSGYVKLEKAGAGLRARCPFHNEKTPSFFVSPTRQNFYCFGCGAKGDIFTFVEQVEGLEFRDALRLLAEKAGVELDYQRGESRTEKDNVLEVLEKATLFFEKELAKSKLARSYITSRGISNATVKSWRIGYAPDDWRLLFSYLQDMGYDKEIITKAGLIKTSETSANKEPYDVFRDRIIFPLADSNGRIIAFSGRALSKETEPKYLNSPDTIVFTKSEVLYGLDKAKEYIRKQNYAVLVEGQMDLVTSHQAGINNTVATSGTAFSRAHLERLKHLSTRIILAFDGDSAGEKATEKASILGVSLGFEVKVASLPEGLDPAEVASKKPEEWKNILRQSLPAVEFFFNTVQGQEKDSRKLGKQIEKRILPMIKLTKSAIEQSYYISLIAKRTGIKEEILWEDLRKAVAPSVNLQGQTYVEDVNTKKGDDVIQKSYQEVIEERLTEVRLWLKDLSDSAPEIALLKKEEAELKNNLSGVILRDELNNLLSELSQAELSKNNKLIEKLTARIRELHGQIRALEEKKKIL